MSPKNVKSIRLSPETHRLLTSYILKLQEKKNKRISVSEALFEILTNGIDSEILGRV